MRRVPERRGARAAASLAIMSCLCTAVGTRRAEQDKTAGIELRVDALIRRMTLAEKLAILGGDGGFDTTAIPRLGIRALKMSDGPMGVRNYGPSTAYPAGVALAATWDTSLARRVGRSMGRDARARGVDILLGPDVNIQRVAVAGRNFEAYSEDPYLAGQIAAAFVGGVQSEGVVATVKHFAAYNQEHRRHSIIAELDERTLHEIYLPAFKAAVEQGHAWGVMTAYNRVNGVHASENKTLLTDILKGRWGFPGFVMSDWGATHDGIRSALAGLDMEMPSARRMNRSALLKALRSGKLPESAIDDKVRRILRAAISMGLFQRFPAPGHAPLESETSDHVALAGAREAVVLLSNHEGLLPLDRAGIHSIAVLGPNASPAVTGGGGSSHVAPEQSVSVLQGIRELAGPGIRVDFLPFPAKGDNAAYSVLAARDDVAVVCAGFDSKTEREGSDRSFGLLRGQDGLIEAAARANRRTIVVLNSGGAVGMTGWVGQVGALLEAWYPGQEGGRAIAEILFGKVNPSGKLPETFERRWGDAGADRNYPGRFGKEGYKEGIFVGYRWFDRAAVKPLFPFGYGLSYSTFAYGGLQAKASASGVAVRFEVRNTSTRAGAEVAEIYVRDAQPREPRPVKELKAFARVELQPGEARVVRALLPRSAFAWYDAGIHGWRVDPGRYEILVGPSSAEIMLRDSVTLPGGLARRLAGSPAPAPRD